MKLSLINHASKRVVVVGGGSAGISTAARLSKSRDIDVTLVDGSKKHYYQPIWTLVGGGLYNFSDSCNYFVIFSKGYVTYLLTCDQLKTGKYSVSML